MAPLEPWEKVLIDGDAFMETVHGELGCIECHNGNAVATEKEAAHVNLVARPSTGAAEVCAQCHERQVGLQATSLHASLAGYWTALEARGANPHGEEITEMFGNHCASCHTGCGDCHVSQPRSVGGGLLNGHLFTAKPPMTRTCTACHGSRVGNEYMGKNEGVLADVHFRQGRMTCIACHDGDELHGEQIHILGTDELPEEPLAHRYAGEVGPRCEQCHENYGSSAEGIREHMLHGDLLSCQVCHATTYVNCDSCHVAVSESAGQPYFQTAATYFTFLIGRNPLQSAERPYEYVPVRHVPIDPGSFAFYGENLLPDFGNLPTWRYATPHNIQRNTPQTESCNHCHGNLDLFLTADKVKPEELEANAPVIVEEVPEAQN